jgi:peptidoglycan/LPS O-acetylase OafA/YrhL
MNYRADIDGLRAIAVLSVVIFHLDVAGFQGGYIGVDVFFVISGFLITSIIKDKYEQQSFALPDFYFRRIRRLVPPLIATIAATLLASAFILTPYDMVGFARSAAAALFSLSNFVFYSESGYWDSASELKPLLHTWSLGVEEQFYLFWPALIIGLLGIRRHISFGASLAIVSIAGALLCIWFTGVDQSAAFYLLPFRVFQFAIGASLIPLVAALQRESGSLSRWLPTAAFWSGLLCIGASVFTFSGTTAFPGWAVLLPTVGSALMLLSGALPRMPSTAARILMQNPLSIWLGRVSYSMYLVHWPVIVLYRYRYGIELEPFDQLLLAAATLFATCVLHYSIERRFYQRGTAGSAGAGAFALRTALVAGVVALVSTSAWLGDGWSWRFPTLALTAEQIKQGKKDRFQRSSRACTFKDNLSSPQCDLEADIQVLVLGNSAEVDGYNFIYSGYGEDSAINFMLFGSMNQCKSLREESGRFLSSEEPCRQMLDVLFDPDMLARIDIVIYAANQPYDTNKRTFLSILRQLKASNPDLRVVTFGSYINNRRHCTYYVNRDNTTDACAKPENVVYFADDERGEPLSGEFGALESHYIDRVDLLCKNRVLETCATRSEDGTPMQYDTRHSSFEFARMSGERYAERYPNLLRDLASP